MTPTNAPGLNDYWTLVVTILLVAILFLVLRFLQKRG